MMPVSCAGPQTRSFFEPFICNVVFSSFFFISLCVEVKVK